MACNHTSNLDPMVLGGYFPRTLFAMAKRELYFTPPVAWFLAGCNCIPVDRGGADRRAVSRALDVLRRGGRLLIFIEGTRSRDGAMQRAEAGVGFLARRSGAPVLPVSLSTDDAPRGLLRRREIVLRYGVPFALDLDGRRDDPAIADEIAARVAALLPRVAPRRVRPCRCADLTQRAAPLGDLRRGAADPGCGHRRGDDRLRARRPRGLPEGLAALGGALLMLLFGLAVPAHARDVVSGNWNVLLFFAGLLAVAGLADEAGVFEAITALALRLGGGSPLRLLLAVCAVGGVVTAFLSNDATALILTPVVALAAQRAGADPIPYALATSYVADAASALLPVANPVNILTIDATHVGLGTYLRVLLLPAILVFVATVVALVLVLRRRLEPLRVPPAAAPPSRLLRPAAVVLVALGVAYVVATTLRAPVGVVAAAGALVLAVVVARDSPRRLRRLRRDVSWSVLLFVAGLLVVVQGLEDTGVTGPSCTGGSASVPGHRPARSPPSQARLRAATSSTTSR